MCTSFMRPTAALPPKNKMRPSALQIASQVPALNTLLPLQVQETAGREKKALLTSDA